MGKPYYTLALVAFEAEGNPGDDDEGHSSKGQGFIQSER
jgi:hypothetical protein